MANLLLTPANWDDQQYGAPPISWTGSIYAFVGPSNPAGQSGGEYAAQADIYLEGGKSLGFTGTVHAGDFVGFTSVNQSDNPIEFIFQVNGATVVDQVIAANGGTFDWQSAPLSAGDSLTFVIGASSTFSYDQLWLVTPASITPTAFWQDLVNCAEH